MRKVALFACLLFCSASALSEVLPCETLQARVDAKLQSKGVPSYTLELEEIDSSKNNIAASGASPTKTNKGKEVGTCDAGTKRLIYTRGN